MVPVSLFAGGSRYTRWVKAPCATAYAGTIGRSIPYQSCDRLRSTKRLSSSMRSRKASAPSGYGAVAKMAKHRLRLNIEGDDNSDSRQFRVDNCLRKAGLIMTPQLYRYCWKCAIIYPLTSACFLRRQVCAANRWRALLAGEAVKARSAVCACRSPKGLEGRGVQPPAITRFNRRQPGG